MLLEELKSYLQITWNDPDTDNNLQGIINRGQIYLNRKAGATLDFDEDNNEKQLLLDYGRYVYNHSFELFEINFRRELLNLALREGVKARANSETDSETST